MYDPRFGLLFRLEVHANLALKFILLGYKPGQTVKVWGNNP